MGFVHDNPIGFAPLYRMPVAYHVTLTLAVDAFTDIAFITEDFTDVTHRPEIFLMDARPPVTGAARRPFIQHWCEDAITIECGGNLRRSYPVNRPCENLPNDRRRFFINDEAVFILRVFHITIRGKGTEEQPFLRPHTLGVFDL